MSGRVPSHVERDGDDLFGGQSHRHRHLVDVDGPILEQLESVEEPGGPVGPRGGATAEEWTRHKVETAVVVARDGLFVGPPGKRDVGGGGRRQR